MNDSKVTILFLNHYILTKFYKNNVKMRQKSVTEEPTNEINGTLRAKISFSTEFFMAYFMYFIFMGVSLLYVL